MSNKTITVERVQTGVRMEKRLVKVLKSLAEYLDISFGDLLEGVVLHAFEGKAPFGKRTMDKIKQIKEVLKAIEDKQFMLKLRDHISGPPKTLVLVGMEDILPAMKDFSMVVSPYNDRNILSGAVGIIGPTRMNYKKLIPVVDHTAKELSQILSKI